MISPQIANGMAGMRFAIRPVVHKGRMARQEKAERSEGNRRVYMGRLQVAQGA